MQKVCSTQELSAADVDALAQRKSFMRQQAAKLQGDAHSMAGESLALEMQVKGALGELQQRLSEYSSQCNKLQLLPLGAKYSFGIDFSVKLNESYLDRLTVGEGTAFSSSSSSTGEADESMAMDGAGLSAAHTGASAATTSKLIGADFKAVIRPQLKELKGKMVRQAGEHGRVLLEMQETMASLVDAQTATSKTLENVSGREEGEGAGAR